MHARDLFSRIVVGVDGTPQSLEAVRQALRLGVPGGEFCLFYALNLVPALAVGWSVPQLADEGGGERHSKRRRRWRRTQRGGLSPAARWFA